MPIVPDDRKARILNTIQKFKKDAEEYTSIESKIAQKNDILEEKERELSEVAHEERIREMAEEVLFPSEQRQQSKTKEIGKELKDLETGLISLQDKLNKIKAQLTKSMHNLPIPADLDKAIQEEGTTVFPFFENVNLGENVLKVMCQLLKMKKLEFQGVDILSDKVVVDGSSSTNEGITKLASGITAYRLKLGAILEAYEQIDLMVDRAMRSELYPRILKMLLIEKEMSSEDMAKKLGENGRKVYDACYNLTRDSWSPNPLESAKSGKWTLTISGEILANRLLEKHPEKAEVETASAPST